MRKVSQRQDAKKKEWERRKSYVNHSLMRIIDLAKWRKTFSFPPPPRRCCKKKWQIYSISILLLFAASPHNNNGRIFFSIFIVLPKEKRKKNLNLEIFSHFAAGLCATKCVRLRDVRDGKRKMKENFGVSFSIAFLSFFLFLLQIGKENTRKTNLELSI